MRIFKRIGLSIIFNAIALYPVTEFLDKVMYTGGWKFFLIAGLVMGFLNAIVKPILKLLSLPFIILTLGLMLVVINALLLFMLEKFIGYLAISDVSLVIDGFLMYLIGGFIFGLVNWIEHLFIKIR